MFWLILFFRWIFRAPNIRRGCHLWERWRVQDLGQRNKLWLSRLRRSRQETLLPLWPLQIYIQGKLSLTIVFLARHSSPAGFWIWRWVNYFLFSPSTPKSWGTTQKVLWRMEKSQQLFLDPSTTSSRWEGTSPCQPQQKWCSVTLAKMPVTGLTWMTSSKLPWKNNFQSRAKFESNVTFLCNSKIYVICYVNNYQFSCIDIYKNTQFYATLNPDITIYSRRKDKSLRTF